MRNDRLILAFGDLPMFDKKQFELLAKLGPRSSSVALSRKISEGVVVPLRRGLYTLNPRLRRAPLTAAIAANRMIEPSYLSSIWALAQHGAILEMVCELTSVTTKMPTSVDNTVGRFSYQHLDEKRFFGFEVRHDGVLLATPEKALLDWMYLQRRYLPLGQIEAELRLQSDAFDVDVLQQMAARMDCSWVEKMAGEVGEFLLEEKESWGAAV